jgi:hypothetical protein
MTEGLHHLELMELAARIKAVRTVFRDTFRSGKSP